MADSIRPNVDSREGFPADEQEAHEAPYGWDEIEGDEPSQDDLGEMCEYWEDMEMEFEDEYDGQPDEYTEWQDLYGGDDYQYGSCDYNED